MKLSQFKQHLKELESVQFQLANGNFIPAHFHVTELGLITRQFIDCGGKIRNAAVINFQIWVANDVEHRLTADKLQGIIRKSEKLFALEDHEIEVEYQTETIGKYTLGFENGVFLLQNTYTACLAEDHCGIPESQQGAFIPLESVTVSAENACCTPNSACC